MKSSIAKSAAIALVCSCGASPQRDRQHSSVRFEVRSLETTIEGSTEYGTSYVHRATVIALGDTVSARLPYLVAFRVERITGGDPGSLRGADDISIVLVDGGVGQFAESGGYKSKTETWEPEKIRVKSLGFVQLQNFEMAPVGQVDDPFADLVPKNK